MCWTEFLDVLFLLQHLYPDSPCDINGSISSLWNFKGQILAHWGYLPCLFEIVACLCPSWFSALQKNRALSCLNLFFHSCGWLGTLLLFGKGLYLSVFSLCSLLSFWRPPFGTILLSIILKLPSHGS